MLQGVGAAIRRAYDESVRLMSANLSLVGMRSCSALYHVDFISSETGLQCRFFHTWFQAVRGNFLTILISVGGLPFIASMCRTLYIRRLKCLVFVWCKGGHISHVDEKVAKMHKLRWDSGCIGRVDDSLLGVPVTEKIRCNSTASCAQRHDSVV